MAFNSSLAEALMTIGQTLPGTLRQRQLDEQARQDTINQKALNELSLQLKKQELEKANQEAVTAKQNQALSDQGNTQYGLYKEAQRINPAIADLKSGKGLESTPTPYSMDYLESQQPAKSNMELANKFNLPYLSKYNTGLGNVMTDLEAEQKAKGETAKTLQEHEWKTEETKTKQENENKQKELDRRNQQLLADKRIGQGSKGNQIVGYDENGDPIYGNTSQKLSPNIVKGIAEFKNFPKLLNNLKTSIDESSTIMGPMEGRWEPFLGKLGVVNKKTLMSNDLISKYEAVKQIVAKGLEGGVLRKEDMPKYQKMIGDITRQPQFAKQNIQNLEQMLSSNYKTYLDALRDSGHYVPDSYYMNKEKKEDKQNDPLGIR